jgi:signal transduction histidine kinase
VDELLEYTRGRHSEATQGEINPWLKKVLEEITTPENVALVTELSPDLPMVRFDRDKMHRVVFNLVNNALQAITARHDRLNKKQGPYQPKVKVSTSVADNGIRIEVEDNGIGMDKKTAIRAFEPLFTTSARGTGLGLAIVRKIVEEHGGHVSLDSVPNHGTKVTLVIPEGVKN